MTRRTLVLVSVAVVVAAAAGAVTVLPDANRATAAAPPPSSDTAAVERGDLSDLVSAYGTLTFRARSDGSPYSAINQARGTYTELPAPGDTVACGHVLYRVDDRPVVLLCGSTPVYRSLEQGDAGADVAELNANLVRLGYATTARLAPSADTFGSATASALEALQSALGEARTGSLDLGAALFLPEAVRVADVTGELGGAAPRGTQVLSATSDTPEVHVALDPSEQGAVRKGDRAQITLPNSTSVTGTVTRVGTVVVLPAGQDGTSGRTDGTGGASVPVRLSLDHPERARGLDQAPVRVELATTGVRDVLSVPVTAIVATSGGGFAVEVVRAAGRRELVAVTLGLFDNADGRVQIDGAVREGDDVVVPSP